MVALGRVPFVVALGRVPFVVALGRVRFDGAPGNVPIAVVPERIPSVGWVLGGVEAGFGARRDRDNGQPEVEVVCVGFAGG